MKITSVLVLALLASSLASALPSVAKSNAIKYISNSRAKGGLQGVQGAAAFPYSWVDLRKFLFYAYAAFCFDNLKDWSCFWCLSQNVTGQYPQVNKTVPPAKVDVLLESDGLYGTYGYTAATKESLIIAFRGSSSTNNVIHDLEFWTSPYPNISGAMVHHGFLSSYNAVRETLRASMKKLRAANPFLPILITGHSLGAAQAVLAATDLGLLGYSNLTLVTFGQPRTGNQVFAALTQKVVATHYRIVNMNDIVPHLPPPNLLFGYHHNTQEIWFQNNGVTFQECSPTNGEDPKCADSLEPWDYRPADHETYLDIQQGLQDGHGCGGPPSS